MKKKVVFSLALLMASGFYIITGCATATKNGANAGTPSRPFPQYASTGLAVAPMPPSGMTREQTNNVIVGLFREVLLNDLIVDSSGPSTRDGFRMVFRHFQEEVVNEILDVSHITTSVSHGYGMTILAYMAGCERMLGFSSGDWIFGSTSLRDYFDAMLRTVIAFQNQDSGMFAGRLLGYQVPEGVNRGGYRLANGLKTAPFTRDLVTGQSSANGDMDIIYALLLADRQWGSGGTYNYREIAVVMLSDLWNSCVHDEYNVMLLGDWVKAFHNPMLMNTIRTSDFKLAHLNAFRDADPAHNWQLVVDSTVAAIRDIRTAQNGLGNTNGFLPEYAVRGPAGWQVPAGEMPLGPYSNTFAYNAAFVPWRLGAAYMLSGDLFLRDSVIVPIDDFARAFTGGVHLERFGPMSMNGTLMDGGVDPNWFAPPFAVTAAAAGSDQGWVDAFWKYVPLKDWDFQGLGVYQGDTDYVRLIVLLTITGNFWGP